jgi:hypothetical protein
MSHIDSEPFPHIKKKHINEFDISVQYQSQAQKSIVIDGIDT